jgi:hypothetical protein
MLNKPLLAFWINHDVAGSPAKGRAENVFNLRSDLWHIID